MTVFEIEDILDKYKVSTYPNGNTASLGAYHSTISYTKLESCINDCKDRITHDEWLICIDYWKGNSYLGSMFSLLSLWCKRLIDKIYDKTIEL